MTPGNPDTTNPPGNTSVVSTPFHSDEAGNDILDKVKERIKQKIEDAGHDKGTGPEDISKHELIDLLKELAKENTAEGRWVSDWIKERETAQKPGTTEKESVLDEPGMHRVLEPEEVALGKQAHRQNEIRPGEKDEVGVTDRNGKPSGRMDRYDKDRRHIREIKPENAEGIRDGTEQLRRYRREKERETGEAHTIELTLWRVDENGNFIYTDYIVLVDGTLVPRQQWERDHPSPPRPPLTPEEHQKATEETRLLEEERKRQEEERKRQEEERRRQQEERKRQEEERKRQENEFRRQAEHPR